MNEGPIIITNLAEKNTIQTMSKYKIKVATYKLSKPINLGDYFQKIDKFWDRQLLYFYILIKCQQSLIYKLFIKTIKGK